MMLSSLPTLTTLYFQGACCQRGKAVPPPQAENPRPPSKVPQVKPADQDGLSLIKELQVGVKNWILTFWQILKTDFLALFYASQKNQNTNPETAAKPKGGCCATRKSD